MKKILQLFFLITLLLVAACSSERTNFLAEGDFKGFNEGELYIYGNEGTHALDTVAVVKGHFHYEIPLEDTTLFVMVFPNYTELPFLGAKGATVKVEGDATHLRETSIKGIRENEEMTAFRSKTSGQTPPELARSVATFIQEHPASPFATYLVRRHFIQAPRPDYQQAVSLLKLVQKARPDQKQITALIQQLQGLQALKIGGQLPKFTATDVNGRQVSSSDLNAQVNVITIWATWNYESTAIQRRLQASYNKNKDHLKVLSICLDADVKDCRRRVERDSVKWSTICDGHQWDTPLLRQIGLSYVPDNLVTDAQGKIIAHSLNNNDLDVKIEELLPKTP